MELLASAATELETLAVVPWAWLPRTPSGYESVVPLVAPHELDAFLSTDWSPSIIELNGWDASSYRRLRDERPSSVVAVRIAFHVSLDEALQSGCRVFHLTADYHGGTSDGFVLDAIWAAHAGLVSAGIREEVTLIGSGGLTAAEHVPKAIIAGLDAVALDTPIWIALQGRLVGEAVEGQSARVEMPEVDSTWALQRIINLIGSWRDQLLEILGAMGLREVRRLRGEIGRSMLQVELEREAFGEIEGYPND